MSSTTNRSPDFPDSTSESSASEASHVEKPTMLLKPPARPKLVAPPKRPEVEAEKSSVPQPSHRPISEKEISEKEKVLTSKLDKAAIQPNLPRQQPISPPSEPMQYRAIGLIRGYFRPSEEQFNRGNLVTEDEVAINAVLLGRVTSLIKKHLDLDKPHLWVVYPRTRDKTEDSEIDLHVQIVGVWEPETLNQPDQPSNEAESEAAVVESEAAATGESKVAVVESEAAAAATVESEAAATAETEAATGESEGESEAAATGESEAATEESTIIQDAGSSTQAKDSSSPFDVNGSELLLQDDYFSIRGEVINYSEEGKQIVIKILQGAKRPSDDAKSFKLMIQGVLTGKTVGYFWDLDVQRQSRSLVLQAASPIGAVPPKKRAKKKSGFRSGASGGRNQRPKPKKGVKAASTNNPSTVVKKFDKAQRSDV